jgi:putative membrane protein
MDLQDRVFAIHRPHPRLWTLYLIRCVLMFPLAPIALPVLWFRYHTMRFRFDAEGVNMRWGIIFRREIQLTYSRIQDIHLSSGLVQRWLGLADIQVQTASGSAQAEMTLEGLLEHEMVRDFLYQRMRGLRDHPHADAVTAAPAQDASTAKLLHDILVEVRGAREALERAAR